MIFNFWRPFRWFKPKKDGEYLCVIDNPYELRYVVQLSYTEYLNKWENTGRSSVFEGYKVYKHGRATIEDNRVYSDRLCDRTREVVAWKKLPKPCKMWKSVARKVDKSY